MDGYTWRGFERDCGLLFLLTKDLVPVEEFDYLRDFLYLVLSWL